jgi:hypothetical protein
MGKVVVFLNCVGQLLDRLRKDARWDARKVITKKLPCQGDRNHEENEQGYLGPLNHGMPPLILENATSDGLIRSLKQEISLCYKAC